MTSDYKSILAQSITDRFRVDSASVGEYWYTLIVTTKERDEVIKAVQIKDMLDRVIAKAKKETDDYIEGKPVRDKPKTMGDDIWQEMCEERYEYLSDFLSRMTFIRDYPEREMQV